MTQVSPQSSPAVALSPQLGATLARLRKDVAGPSAPVVPDPAQAQPASPVGVGIEALKVLTDVRDRLAGVLTKAGSGPLPAEAGAEIRALAGMLLSVLGEGAVPDQAAPSTTAAVEMGKDDADTVAKAIVLDDATAASLMLETVQDQLYAAKCALREGDMAKAAGLLGAAQAKIGTVAGGMGGGATAAVAAPPDMAAPADPPVEPMEMREDAEKQVTSFTPASFVRWAEGEVKKANEGGGGVAPGRLEHMAAVLAAVLRKYEGLDKLPPSFSVVMLSAYAPMASGPVSPGIPKVQQSISTQGLPPADGGMGAVGAFRKGASVYDWPMDLNQEPALPGQK